MARNIVFNKRPYHLISASEDGAILTVEALESGRLVMIREELMGEDDELNSDPTDAEWADALDLVGLHVLAAQVRPPTSTDLYLRIRVTSDYLTASDVKAEIAAHFDHIGWAYEMEEVKR